MARYLELILAWLISRFGEKVLKWTLQEVVDYFRDHPQQGMEATQECVEKYVSEMETDDDPFFWDKPHWH